MGERKASIKETGEELSQEEWARFERTVAADEAERPKPDTYERDKAEKRPDSKNEI